jgi:hypothetical protein
VKIPYPIVCNNNPFFYVAVSGIDLTSITTTGDTKLQVYRVTKGCDAVTSPDSPVNAINYNVVEQKKNKFTFALDSQLFNMDGGRYRADFYYKGTYIHSTEFMYAKQLLQLSGSSNV